MPNEVEEIKSRLDIVDIVSEYVRLKQAGTNWKANCPFHAEKTPSFMVSKEKQIWHCFGCGEGGDIFTFVQKIENLEFPEALKILAQKAGVKLQPRDPKVASQKNKLTEICELTAKYWHNYLLKSQQSETARKYLQGRKISDDTVDEFNIGYSPDSWEETSKFLLEKGYSEQEIFLAGLTVKKEKGSGFYDRFRGRLIFPILNNHGETIAFGGRTMKEEEGAKYINSPQTLVYNKSFVLYNLDKAKSEIKRLNYAILVEGYTDVIASWQAGVKNVIASSGTALTIEQVRLLKRYANNLIIAYDADLAGEAASGRGIDLALAEELNVKIINLGTGQDPDELIRQDPEKWRQAIKDAESIVQYHFNKTFKDLDLSNIEKKKKAAADLLKVISKIGNKIEQNHWLQKLSEKLNTPEEILREILLRSKPDLSSVKPVEEIKKPVKNRPTMLSERIMAIALKYPKNINYIADHLKPQMLTGEDLRELYKNLLVYYTENRDLSEDFLLDFKNNLKSSKNNNQISLLIDTLILLAEKEFFDFEQNLIRDETIKIINDLKKNYIVVRLKELEADIAAAESNADTSKVESLTEKFKELANELNLIDNNI